METIYILEVSQVYMSELREKILEVAHGLFTRYGVRSITMDDIARELSISKKTIYQEVKDKDEVVKMATRFHLEGERREYDEIAVSSKDAIDQLVKLSVCMRKNLHDINPSLLFDLKKYHRSAWDEWVAFKMEFIHNSIVENLRWGIREGLFKEDISVEILAIMRLQQVEMSFDNAIYPTNKFDFRDVQMVLFDHFICGIVNAKGRAFYDQYRNQLLEK